MRVIPVVLLSLSLTFVSCRQLDKSCSATKVPEANRASTGEIKKPGEIYNDKIKKLGRIIKNNQDDDIWESSKAFRELLIIWDPIGKSTAEIQSILGRPHKSSQTQMTYRYDDGYNGHMWLFEVEHGRIVKMSHESID